MTRKILIMYFDERCNLHVYLELNTVKLPSYETTQEISNESSSYLLR